MPKERAINSLNIGLTDFSEAALIVDTTFQSRPKPATDFQTGKILYSGKHHSYSIKKKLSHLPNRAVCFISKWHPGSHHDSSIFLEQEKKYHDFLYKQLEEVSLSDTSINDIWAIVPDKGYIRIEKDIRVILSYKKPKNGYLTVEQLEFNIKVARMRIIHENFYRRMKRQFRIMKKKFRDSLIKYDKIFDCCAALTNFLIRKYPLRIEDLELYNRILE